MYHDPDSPSPACSIRSVLRKLFIVIQNLSDEQSISRISEASASLLTTVFSTVTYCVVCHQPHPSNGVSMSNFYRGVERESYSNRYSSHSQSSVSRDLIHYIRVIDPGRRARKVLGRHQAHPTRYRVKKMPVMITQFCSSPGHLLVVL
jgi:hypothetical protein